MTKGVEDVQACRGEAWTGMGNGVQAKGSLSSGVTAGAFISVA